MSKNENGTGLVHAGVFNGVVLWEMYWKNKIVFYVKVDTADPELVIKVQSLPQLDQPAVILPTNGRAAMVLDTKSTGDGEADVEVIERVSSTSVQAYIYPRVRSMVMRLYVPGYADVTAA